MLELLIQYQYIFLFFGLIVLGETVFFPAAYLVYIGEMKFVPVFIIGLAATLIADVVWYFIGKYMHFWKYFGVNVLAVSILHLGIYALVILAGGGTDVVQNETHKFMLIMTFLVVVVVFLHQWAIRYLRRI